MTDKKYKLSQRIDANKEVLFDYFIGRNVLKLKINSLKNIFTTLI